MRYLFMLFFSALFSVGFARGSEVKGAVTKQEYMAYMTAAAEEGWSKLEADREGWRKSIDLKYVFGYNPPGNEPYLAALSANLYEITRDEKYLDRVRLLLLYYGKHREAYPADFFKSKAEYAGGLPALPNIFTFPKYVHAYAILKKYRTLEKKDEAVIVDNIAGSTDFLIDFQEWGPMNRAMLRAESILYAAKVLANHPRRPIWQMAGEAIAGDSRKGWEIEDATGYHAVWLYSLLGYASDVCEDESIYRTAIMHYYFQYFLALICPAGLVPDFGDADWGSGWDRMIPFFEKGATVYRDPALRWAASRFYRGHLDPLPSQKSVFVGLTLSDAYRWASFDLPATPPSGGSQEVLDDIVGKKIVFRKGWDDRGTYLLHNYRDEGDGGWLFRDYLRTTLTVEEEKMHHGHSDENSISLLMKNNSILLHDGGYRDFMPSGPFGAYRADYFHNRLVVRDGKIATGQREGQYRFEVPKAAAVPGQAMLSFFRNSGVYREVRTRKIDFLTLKRVDMSRTRLIDDHLGYEADRIINYVKDLDVFVIFDVLRFTKESFLTMANLWHTRQVVAHGEGWYDTAYDSLRTADVRGEERLLIYFPQQSRMEEGVETQTRYYQQEKVIYQLIGRHGYPGDLQTFVTILIPHPAGKDVGALLKQIAVLTAEEYPKEMCVRIVAKERTYLIGAKLDLQAELARDWRRPKYDYESGKAVYGDYETDAHNLFVMEEGTKIEFAIVGGTKAKRGDRVLHEQRPVTFGLNLDGTAPLTGIGKLRYWEEEVEK